MVKNQPVRDPRKKGAQASLLRSRNKWEGDRKRTRGKNHGGQKRESGWAGSEEKRRGGAQAWTAILVEHKK